MNCPSLITIFVLFQETPYGHKDANGYDLGKVPKTLKPKSLARFLQVTEVPFSVCPIQLRLLSSRKANVRKAIVASSTETVF
jgi:hypothetical protein